MGEYEMDDKAKLEAIQWELERLMGHEKDMIVSGRESDYEMKDRKRMLWKRIDILTWEKPE